MLKRLRIRTYRIFPSKERPLGCLGSPWYANGFGSSAQVFFQETFMRSYGALALVGLMVGRTTYIDTPQGLYSFALRTSDFLSPPPSYICIKPTFWRFSSGTKDVFEPHAGWICFVLFRCGTIFREDTKPYQRPVSFSAERLFALLEVLWRHVSWLGWAWKGEGA